MTPPREAPRGSNLTNVEPMSSPTPTVNDKTSRNDLLRVHTDRTWAVASSASLTREVEPEVARPFTTRLVVAE